MHSTSSTFDYSTRQALQPALIDFLIRECFEWHLTANFNRVTTPENGRTKLCDWSKYVDRQLHGRRFYRKGRVERLFFVAIPEIGVSTGHLHYHLLARLPNCDTDHFPRIAEAMWARFNPTGSMYIQRIGSTTDDLERVVRYDTKDVWKHNGYEQMIWSTEFSPRS